ncbi:kinase-like domain-containing protein [Mycena alexandri]|uniref:Kinase-like domain-containing protein n=1 Tax=Mycena alexandri TaxID=1745969 RepID=A0AAD6S1B8_9AGAR|nr:kinase-like domain-containing protein [Mycena alexandri]
MSAHYSVAILQCLVHHVYLSCISNLTPSRHFCSPTAPCRVALPLLAPFRTLKLVSSLWKSVADEYKIDTFFLNVEEGVYYPHAWHINTRLRKAVLLSRYRIFRTIDSDGGTSNRGVYVAYDFGGSAGCAGASEVVIKAWVSGSDVEYHREAAAYKLLRGCPGVPATLQGAQYEPLCDVHILPMQKLGPSLEDLMSLLPNRQFDLRMVLTVAIQMTERYRDIHARGVIHSGAKPGNICFAPRSDAPGTLYAIDFGFSLALADNLLIPSAHRIDSVGNRRFMSVLAHHGISKSQRDDLESLGYLLSYLFHGQLPWDPPRPVRSRSIATPASKIFEGMDACFHEFWRDVKALAYGEVPDYEKLRGRFAVCLQQHEKGCAPYDWWDIWDQFNS